VPGLGVGDEPLLRSTRRRRSPQTTAGERRPSAKDGPARAIGFSAASWISEQQVGYTGQLARVTKPLLLWGEQDPISPLTVGRRLAAILPNSRLTVLPGGTHLVALQQPAAVAQAIIRHLS